MATGPCQAGFAGTHYYIYLEGGEYRRCLEEEECNAWNGSCGGGCSCLAKSSAGVLLLPHA
jgi:hypothetical protein